MLVHEDVTAGIIGAAMEVHRFLGPGLLESAYEQCLCHELGLRGIDFRSQVDQPIIFKGMRLEAGYRIDLLIEELVIVELKAVEHVLPVHVAQLMSYLRLSSLRIGLLINFNVPILKDGITRRIL